MADKMLIDASHEEETRVVVVRGNRIEEFDFESQHKKQLRGNIYLAKVTRVEPSLQAAFVEYGGNRHGFLAFSEIHPDYYQIPVADRQALLDAEAEEARAEDDDTEAEKPAKKKSRTRRSRGKSKKEAKTAVAEASDADAQESEPQPVGDGNAPADEAIDEGARAAIEETPPVNAAEPEAETQPADDAVTSADESEEPQIDVEDADVGNDEPSDEPTDDGSADEEETAKKDPPDSIAAAVDTDEVSEVVEAKEPAKNKKSSRKPRVDEDDDDDEDEDSVPVESVGAEDALEEVPDRARKSRKQYRIQEVIKRRQILLVQVVKEERGNKGAALTTYLSLAGRYSVLMPNTARGGGISRKITNVQDRKRLKEIARGLDVPQGMGVILRTAGANRTKAEIKRDFEYLMRLWENVRNLTLSSTAPCLVYEEGSLIKRSIRDLYNKDIGEVIVSGDTGYREAKDFMKMLMPSHAKAVQPYREVQPIFARSGIEAQLDKMLQPQVTLKSGGYIIINQTEALVAIDVNSGRSTKEHSIEDTALRTNLEAAEEVARQLRLRDLAGLIVIDFIDMEEKRNNRSVEKKLKECLKSDRARIQVGRISHFGLLEMSRQRIRASVLESTMQVCDHCGGTGYVRSDSSVALYVLRTIEEYLLRNTKHNLTIRTLPDIALYLLNQKRDTIIELESRFGLSITVEADVEIGQQHIAIDQGEPVASPVVIDAAVQPDLEEETEDDSAETAYAGEDEDGGRKRKRRRRRRGRGNGDEANGQSAEDGSDVEAAGEDDGEQRKKRRRRGKRGGRRNREQDGVALETDVAEQTTALEAGDEEAEASDPADSPDEVEIVVAEAATDIETRASEPIETSVAPEAEQTAEDEKPKPKRRRSPRKKKEEQASDEADPVVAEAETPEPEAPAVSVEAVSETVLVAEADVVTEEKPKRASRRRKTSDDEVIEPKITSTTSETAEDAEKKPKKAGWWQRRGFF